MFERHRSDDFWVKNSLAVASFLVKFVVVVLAAWILLPEREKFFRFLFGNDTWGIIFKKEIQSRSLTLFLTWKIDNHKFVNWRSKFFLTYLTILGVGFLTVIINCQNCMFAYNCKWKICVFLEEFQFPNVCGLLHRRF